MAYKKIAQQPAYRIVKRSDGRFAVYDKHSKFRIVCDLESDAQAYIDEHTKHPQRAAVSTR